MPNETRPLTSWVMAEYDLDNNKCENFLRYENRNKI